MIDPKSLRIGNLVMLPSDTPAVDDGLIKNIATVTGVLGNMVHWEAPCIYAGRCHSGTKPEFLSPIPLDESWLTRASFNKRSPNSGAFDFGRISVIFWPTGQISIEFKNVELGNISFLHEFQNWFRLLTGEELSFAEVGESSSQPLRGGLTRWLLNT